MRRGGIATVLLLMGAVGQPAGYVGVSETYPTGSATISRDALVAAYDMTTLTAEGRLRDFGPHGLHGSFEDFGAGRLCMDHGGRAVRCLGAVTGPGAVTGARSFHVVEDRVDLPEDDAFDLDGPLTVAAWVRVDRLGLHQHIAACDDKWSLWITPDDRYRLGIRGAGWSSAPGAVVEGEWTSVVAVLRGTRGDALTPETISLWVDGEPADAVAHMRTDEAQASGTWNPGELFPDDACHIGFESHQGMESHKTLPFVGALDELLVFGRAWSDDEVRAFSRVAG